MKYMITNKDLYEEIQVSKKEKQKHQVKSQFYYIFWGAATVSVVAGQIFVGSGFRRMSESFEKVLDSPIRLDLGIPGVHKWEDDGLYHPTNPPTPISPEYKEDFERRMY